MTDKKDKQSDGLDDVNAPGRDPVVSPEQVSEGTTDTPDEVARFKADRDRPAYQQLLADVAAGGCDVLMICDSGRLHRDHLNLFDTTG